MDDLSLVRDLAAEQAAPTDRARAVAFARLQTAIGEETGDGSGALARQRPLSRRLMFRAAIAATGTAAVAGTTLLAVRAGGPQLTALNAAQVLRRAADRSRADDNGMPIPRDDQYMYSKEITHRTYDRRGRKMRLVDECWLSVDGSKTTRYIYNGRIQDDPPLGKHEVQSIPLQYSKLKKWPTDPDELLKWFGGGRTPGGSEEAGMFAYFEACLFLRGPRVLPPGLRAAAFEAVAKLPAIKIDHDRVDALGRHGIGISYPKMAFGLVFDPETYAYLGMFERGHSDKNGGFSQVKAVVSQGVVDRIGQRPAVRDAARTTPSTSPSPSPSDATPSTSPGSATPSPTSPSPFPTSAAPTPSPTSAAPTPSATSATPSPASAAPR
ncbi:CU044_5270 family protein [Streptomyces sp. NBC_00151]|uniref:CU044_5270 family protein n=1 Tax=Streptomyces sp. NBC_00151 TaxID=2975669 RepID=UPI002DDB5964|nr:CU044_5270 family protein [Streptomyces sp. NBC_00151]WRZ40231.1 CU044_5270 family protein [Streptomyces sp. NBC_00151]